MHRFPFGFPFAPHPIGTHRNRIRLSAELSHQDGGDGGARVGEVARGLAALGISRRQAAQRHSQPQAAAPDTHLIRSPDRQPRRIKQYKGKKRDMLEKKTFVGKNRFSRAILFRNSRSVDLA